MQCIRFIPSQSPKMLYIWCFNESHRQEYDFTASTEAACVTSHLMLISPPQIIYLKIWQTPTMSMCLIQCGCCKTQDSPSCTQKDIHADGFTLIRLQHYEVRWQALFLTLKQSIQVSKLAPSTFAVKDHRKDQILVQSSKNRMNIGFLCGFTMPVIVSIHLILGILL